MGRHRGIGQKRKGKKQGAPTPTKKSRMRVQQVSAEKAKKHLHDTREVENWITKMNEIASEAGVTAKKGLGYGAGEARIIIRAVINTIHARKGGLKWSTAKQQPQLQEVYDDMAGLFGMSHMVVRELFEDFIENKVITIKDESTRGSGSVNAEPKRLRTNEQYAAIEAFVDFCNSKAGGGKYTLEQIQKYMEEGPRLNSDDPRLDSGLRVHIPKSAPVTGLTVQMTALIFKILLVTSELTLMRSKRQMNWRMWVVVMTTSTWGWPGGIFRQPKTPIFHTSRLNHGMGIIRRYTNAKKREGRAILCRINFSLYLLTSKMRPFTYYMAQLLSSSASISALSIKTKRKKQPKPRGGSRRHTDNR